MVDKATTFCFTATVIYRAKFKSFFFYKHKNKSQWYFQINWIKCFTVSPWQQSHYVFHRLAKPHIILGMLACRLTLNGLLWVWVWWWQEAVNNMICTTLKDQTPSDAFVLLFCLVAVISLLYLNHVECQVISFCLWALQHQQKFLQSSQQNWMYNWYSLKKYAPDMPRYSTKLVIYVWI